MIYFPKRDVSHGGPPGKMVTFSVTNRILKVRVWTSVSGFIFLWLPKLSLPLSLLGYEHFEISLPSDFTFISLWIKHQTMAL